jgi:hypothetical protein
MKNGSSSYSHGSYGNGISYSNSSGSSTSSSGNSSGYSNSGDPHLFCFVFSIT